MSTIEIYYADDDADDLDIFSEAINKLADNGKAGITLNTYTEGNKLLKAIRERKPERAIVFLDINMPGKNGLQVLREIRNESQFNLLPVIMYSTSSDLNTVKVSREMGANLYAIKPAYFVSLCELIKKIMDMDWAAFEPTDANFLLGKHWDSW